MSIPKIVSTISIIISSIIIAIIISVADHLQLKVILIKNGTSLVIQLVAETIILFRTTSVYFIYHKNGLKVYWCYWNSTCKETSILVNLLRPIGPRLSMIEKNSNFVNMGYKC